MQAIRSTIQEIDFHPRFSGLVLFSTLWSITCIALQCLQNAAPKKNPLFLLFQTPIREKGLLDRLKREQKRKGFSDADIATIIQEVLANQQHLKEKMTRWNAKKSIGLHRVPDLYITRGSYEGYRFGSRGKHFSSAISLRLEWLSPTYAHIKKKPCSANLDTYKRQRNFVLLHNIAHIRQQSSWISTALNMSPLVLAPLGFFPGLWPVALILETIDIVASITLGSVVSRHLHKKADRQAAAWSDKARRGGIALLQDQKKRNLRHIRKSSNALTRTWRKMWTRADGSDVINYSNRSLSTRIKDLSQNNRNR